MEKYRLYVRFQLTNDKGGKFNDTIHSIIECEDIEIAENILQSKISEKLTQFSKMGLNWKIIEKNIQLEFQDGNEFISKGFLR